MQGIVHCRIGSLEKQLDRRRAVDCVHCRIGSLETPGKAVGTAT